MFNALGHNKNLQFTCTIPDNDSLQYHNTRYNDTSILDNAVLQATLKNKQLYHITIG